MANDDTYSGFEYYYYTPSKVGAAIMCAVFFFTAVPQLFFLIKRRTWYMIPFLAGIIFEIIGYAARIGSAVQTPNWTLGPYIIQTLMILLGPTLFAASIYMLLGRIVTVLHGESYSLIRPSRLTKVFVLGDIISFLAQGAGGGMLAQAKTVAQVHTGNYTIIGGLIVQIIFFSLFVLVALLFHARIRARPTASSSVSNAPWQPLLYLLYFNSIMILIRSIYRVIEYVQGYSGALQQHEYFIYIFDALPMGLVAIAFTAFHPSRVVNRDAVTHAKLQSASSMNLGEV